MEKLKHIDLYTDGACSQNGTWIGGWGAVLIYGEHEMQISGYKENTTNNQMELLAVIEGLKRLKEKVDVTIYTDSAYVCNAFTNNWLENWQNNGWKTATNKEVQNKQLWLELLDLCSKHNVSWQKVRGHSTNKYNNLCDKLATTEIKNHTPQPDENTSDNQSDLIQNENAMTDDNRKNISLSNNNDTNK